MRETLASASGASPTERPSETIVTLIADLEGTRPPELTPPLYSVVDPEALDSLFHSASADGSDAPGSLRFRYHGYDVHVESDGAISIANGEEEPSLAGAE